MASDQPVRQEPTPGPWKAEKRVVGHVVLDAYGDGGYEATASFVIAGRHAWQIYDDKSGWDRAASASSDVGANARLVAAAPTMRDALKAIQSQCAGHADEFSQRVWKIARAALQHTEGTTP